MLNRLPRLLVLLGLVLAGGGCATPAIPREAAAEPPPVRLIVTNGTTHAWRISLRPVGAATPQAMHIDSQRVVEIRLARGDYLIEQTLLDAGFGSVAQRGFTMRFETGGDYQWELATLLSAGDTLSPSTTAAETASRD